MGPLGQRMVRASGEEQDAGSDFETVAGLGKRRSSFFLWKPHLQEKGGLRLPCQLEREHFPWLCAPEGCSPRVASAKMLSTFRRGNQKPSTGTGLLGPDWLPPSTPFPIPPSHFRSLPTLRVLLLPSPLSLLHGEQHDSESGHPSSVLTPQFGSRVTCDQSFSPSGSPSPKGQE